MSSSVPDEVVVGYAERGQVVPLHVGQRLVVTLGAGWAAPSAHSVARDPEPPLQPLSTEHAVGFPAGPASATFLAVRCGGALVSAHTDTACLHSTPPCAIAQQVFDLSAGHAGARHWIGPAAPAASALTDPDPTCARTWVG